MTDIPSLIERLNSAIRAYETTHNGDSQACELLRDCADAIKASHLTVSPLPEEIAGLIKRLHKYAADWRDRAGSKDIVDEAAAALQQQAREIERLKNAGLECAAENDQLRNHNTAIEAALNARAEQLYPDLQERIRELESANADHRHWKGFNHHIDKLLERIEQLEAERDEWKASAEAISMIWDKRIEEASTAIKEKTIEEALEAVYWFHNVEKWSLGDVASRIRALKQKPQAETAE